MISPMSRPVPVPRPRTVRPSLSLFDCLSRLASARGPAIAAVLAGLLLAAGSGCDGDTGSPGGGGGAGGGGGSGAATVSMSCRGVPQPTFLLRVIEQTGNPVPPDTTVEVMWSAGKELPFHLDDPSTWGTLETSNMVCLVDPDALPEDRMELVCELWTASPTEVRVSAKGYVTQEDTYAAEPAGQCPEPTPIEIELAPEHE